MILTLIAILTGLSWQGAGVQARAMPVTAQVSAVAALATVQQARASAVLARPVATNWLVRPLAGAIAPISQGAPATPGVLVGIDRTRE